MISGHIYGPPAPHLAFYIGDRYLGEVRGHPSDVEKARQRLQAHCRLLQEPGAGLDVLVANSTRVSILCGPIHQSLFDYRASLPKPVERMPYVNLLDLVMKGYATDVPLTGIQATEVVCLVLDKSASGLLGTVVQGLPGAACIDFLATGQKADADVRITASAYVQATTTLAIPLDAWQLVGFKGSTAVVTTVAPKALTARRAFTKGDAAQVEYLSVPRQLEYAQQKPECYSLDFKTLLSAAVGLINAARKT